MSIFTKSFLVGVTLSLLSCTTNHGAQDDDEPDRETLLKHGILRMYHDTHSKGAPFEELDPKSVARGKEIFRNHCMSCHGDKGLGDGPFAKAQMQRPANLAELAHDIPDFKFFMKISQWNGNMPGWNEPFSKKETSDLETYLKKLGREFKHPEAFPLEN